MKDDVFKMSGTVVSALPSATFKVALANENGKKTEVIAKLAGKLLMNKIRVMIGDEVELEISAYDPTKGRIVYRK